MTSGSARATASPTKAASRPSTRRSPGGAKTLLLASRIGATTVTAIDQSESKAEADHSPLLQRHAHGPFRVVPPTTRQDGCRRHVGPIVTRARRLRHEPRAGWSGGTRRATGSQGGRRRRRLRRAPGGARASPRAGRGDARRPPELPPLPAARLPGRDRRALAGRDRDAAARGPQAAGERPRPARPR